MKKIIAFMMLVASVLSVLAQDTFKRSQYVSERGDTLRYRFLTPERIAQDETYPLVIFLHGAGERGNDNESQLVHGGQMWLNPVVREEFPAFIMAPQCPTSGYWAYSERPQKGFAPDSMPDEEALTPVFRSLMELVDTFVKENPVDTDRVYIMGLSMGGMATFDLACRYPERFAAAVPICGSVKPERLSRAAKVPFRIYHGDADNVVPVSASRAAYRALRKAGAKPVYREFPGVTHGSWNPAFSDTELLPWLFAQTKKD